MSQRVVVTAGAAGIGRAIAEAFAQTGATVHVCDVDDAALAECRSTTPTILATKVDLADATAVQQWMDMAIADLSGIDVLVNNAGTKGPTAFVEDVTVEEWRVCLTVGLESHFVCAGRAAASMKAQGHGCIINISSTAGLHGYGMRTPYAAAKWAVIGLTKSLAVELGPHGVRCNAICPGSVRGPRMDAVIAAEAAHRGVAPTVVADEYVAGQSIERFVEAGEIAALCTFLASPAAGMISGQAIAVDGHTETFHL